MFGWMLHIETPSWLTCCGQQTDGHTLGYVWQKKSANDMWSVAKIVVVHATSLAKNQTLE